MINVWEHGDARREALHFCEVHGIQGPVLLDATGEYIARLGLRGVPNNLVVDRRGIVVAVGATTPGEIRSTLTKLLLPLGG
jgi:Tfp pilus assembly ATPase PilU